MGSYSSPNNSQSRLTSLCSLAVEILVTTKWTSDYGQRVKISFQGSPPQYTRQGIR